MRTAFLIGTIFFALPLLAQKNTWLTVEGGYTTTRFQYADNSGRWTAGESPGYLYGFFLRRELSPLFSLEAGYGHLEYGDEYGISKDFYLYDGGNEAHQIPLRLYIDKTVYRDRISLFASLEYTLNIENTNWGYSAVMRVDNKSDTLSSESKSIQDSQFNSMIGGRAGVRFRTFDQLCLNLNLGYNYGFADLRDVSIYYRNASGEMATTNTTTRHQYWFVTLSLTYPMNRARDLIKELLNNSN